MKRDLSLDVDTQNDVHNLSVVELAYGFGLALLPVELSVYLVIDVGRQFREVVRAVGSDDVAFNRPGAGIGEVHHRIGQRIIVAIEHFAGQHAAGIFSVFILILRVGSRDRDAAEKHQHGYNPVTPHGFLTLGSRATYFARVLFQM